MKTNAVALYATRGAWGVGQTMATRLYVDPAGPTLRADVIGVTAGQRRQETPVRWLFTAECNKPRRAECCSIGKTRAQDDDDDHREGGSADARFRE